MRILFARYIDIGISSTMTATPASEAGPSVA
jgi:hypothetical protein